MNIIVGRVLSMVWGFGAGVVLSTGIVSFISMIGIIPRLLSEPKIRSHYLAAGTAASLGIITGTIFYTWNIYIPIPNVLIGIFSVAYGMFIGCLAVALTEVLDVLPIMQRRLKLKKGLHLIIIALSMGKLVGTLYYWLYPGFLSGLH
ncbi:MAG: stage V sporulation protein AB [Cellulosilyticaceae bacterium]